MNTIKLLDRPIAFHRCLVDLTGSVKSALLLSQAIYWQNRCQAEDGWWWKTAEDWEEETGMKPDEFRAARNRCKGILAHKVKGLPAKCFYRVDEDELDKRLANLKTSIGKNHKLVAVKSANRFDEKAATIGTETTSETTSENCAVSGAAPDKPATEAKSEHKAFIKGWVEAFESTFGERYIVMGAKDGVAVKRLLARGDRTAEEYLEIARAAWAHSTDRRRCFNCGASTTIAGYVSKFTQIVLELRAVGALPSAPANEKTTTTTPTATISYEWK